MAAHADPQQPVDTERHDITSSTPPDVDIWPLYLEHALVQDKETVLAWNSDLDSILIFVSNLLITVRVFVFISLPRLHCSRRCLPL